MSDLDHTMFDLETLSTRSNAVIVTLAAVKFSFDHSETESFCMNINPQGQKELGLVISADTVKWWRESNPEAAKQWMHSQHDLAEVLDAYDKFTERKANMWHWMNGMNFDAPILENAYLTLNREVPWKYWNLRDSRTVVALAGIDIRKEPRVGLYHNAIDDCLTQIAHLKKALGKS